ncbi:MAG: hypothetical protein QXU98_13245 [Candidatus Parvarchaeota archaeon]
MKKGIELGLITLVIAIMGLSGGFVNFAHAQANSSYNFVRINESGILSEDSYFPNNAFIGYDNIFYETNYLLVPQIIGSVSGSDNIANVYVDFFNYSYSQGEVGPLVYNVSVGSYVTRYESSQGYYGVSAQAISVNEALYNSTAYVVFVSAYYPSVDTGGVTLSTSPESYVLNSNGGYINISEYLINTNTSVVSAVSVGNFSTGPYIDTYIANNDYYAYVSITYFNTFLYYGGAYNMFTLAFSLEGNFNLGGSASSPFSVIGIYYSEGIFNISSVSTTSSAPIYPITIIPTTYPYETYTAPNYAAMFVDTNGTVFISYIGNSGAAAGLVYENVFPSMVVTPNGVGANAQVFATGWLSGGVGSSGGSWVTWFGIQPTSGWSEMYPLTVYFNNQSIPVQLQEGSLLFSMQGSVPFISPIMEGYETVNGGQYGYYFMTGSFSASANTFNTEMVYFNDSNNAYTTVQEYSFTNPVSLNIFWDVAYFYYTNNNQLYIGINMQTLTPPVIPGSNSNQTVIPPPTFNFTMPAPTYNGTLTSAQLSALMSTGTGAMVIFIVLFLPALLLMVYLGVAGFIGGLGVGIFIGVISGYLPLWAAIFMAILLVFFIYYRSGNPLSKGEKD